MESFWDFSVRTYCKPGVAKACLSLQDRYGLDVNVLLFCCWYGCTRGPLRTETFHRVLSFSEPWANNVVRPLRAARTWMKATGGERDGASQSNWTALRDKIKKTELEAEHLQQTTLEGMVSQTEVNCLETKSQIKANALNLKVYLHHCGITLDVDSTTALAHIATASLRVAVTDEVVDTLHATFHEI